MQTIEAIDLRLNALDRLSLTERLVRRLQQGEAVIGGIGNSNFDLFGVGDRPQNFYMLGSMGMAVPIGLGVALAQPHRQVIVLEGDGSLLMNLGSLATVGMLAPPNLTVIAWDNGCYQMTGGQQTPSAWSTDLVQVAAAAGIDNSHWAHDEEHFERLVQDGLWSTKPTFIAACVAAKPSQAHPEFDPVILKDRFMRGIGAKPAYQP
jgi:thiamine pyrophosphate-dependent acetolactate synthase large subunit-like protein